MLDADMVMVRWSRCKRGLVEQGGACAGHDMMIEDGRKHSYCSEAERWSARDLSCLDRLLGSAQPTRCWKHSDWRRIARIGSYRILVGLGDVYVSPDPETRYDMA
jgi:hypothetical protein